MLHVTGQCCWKETRTNWPATVTVFLHDHRRTELERLSKFRGGIEAVTKSQNFTVTGGRVQYTGLKRWAMSRSGSLQWCQRKTCSKPDNDDRRWSVPRQSQDQIKIIRTHARTE